MTLYVDPLDSARYHAEPALRQLREAVRGLDLEGRPYDAVACLYAANEVADAAIARLDAAYASPDRALRTPGSQR